MSYSRSVRRRSVGAIYADVPSELVSPTIDVQVIRPRARSSLGAPPPPPPPPKKKDLPMGFLGGPGMLPGPVVGKPGIGPKQPAGLFPTNVKWGDVVTVTGPFAGKFQGQVVVRFAGAAGQAPAMQGPYGGSVVVPDGAQTGACTVELDGRVIYATNCTVTPTTGARAPEPRGRAAWNQFSTFGPLSGTLADRTASFAKVFGLAFLVAEADKKLVRKRGKRFDNRYSAIVGLAAAAAGMILFPGGA